jgi:hypothetical protein
LTKQRHEYPQSHPVKVVLKNYFIHKILNLPTYSLPQSLICPKARVPVSLRNFMSLYTDASAHVKSKALVVRDTLAAAAQRDSLGCQRSAL